MRGARQHIQAADAIQPGGQAVGKDLVADHGHLPPRNAQAAARGHEPRRQRFAGQRDPGQADALGKRAHAAGGVVGDDGQTDACGAHGRKPGRDAVVQLLAAVAGEGVVDIQHKRRDAHPAQHLRRDRLYPPENDLWGQ